MTSSPGYSTSVDLWKAVTSRAKVTANAAHLETGTVIRRFVFGRFLARVFHDPSAPWVLKGGTAVLARVHDARTTKDVDLLAKGFDLDAAVQALREAVAFDLADHFRFVITAVDALHGGADQPSVDGCRVRVDAYCGATKKDSFGVDVVTGSLMTGAPETLVYADLDIRGNAAPTLRLYPVVDHIADKLCATQARYGADGRRGSSRVRDLVDLVVFARTQTVEASALGHAVRGEWLHRGLPGRPVFAPPPEWRALYPPLARKVPAVGDVSSFDAAVDLVSRFLTPVLDGARHGHWDPDACGWSDS